jgi:hypothetical protein
MKKYIIRGFWGRGLRGSDTFFVVEAKNSKDAVKKLYSDPKYQNEASFDLSDFNLEEIEEKTKSLYGKIVYFNPVLP